MPAFQQRVVDRMSPGLLRVIFNLWPPFWGAGIHITKISPDFRDISVVMKLHWYNRNYMGVHFGGSLYSMTDAFPMIMTARNIGEGYIVWDKAAKIEYIKPGRGTVHAHFTITPEKIAEIKTQADTHEKYLFDYEINVVDDQNNLISKITKTIYVRKKTEPSPP